MLVEENNIPITVEFLKKKGFKIKLANKHVWDIQAYGEYFDVRKRIKDDFFTISFHTYYDDVEFENFKYEHQILNLYYCLVFETLKDI